MKIVFFGSDDFALRHVETLLTTEHQIVGCVTQPDKPKGRGLELTASPIKQFALKHKIPVLQPFDVKGSEFIASLKKLNADIFVVIAYGKILPSEVLSIPSKGAINVHGSLLPKYRGAAPINWAIINGETKTGLTIIQMNPSMDAGDIISQAVVEILPEDNSITLREKMMASGCRLLTQTLKNIEQNNLSLQAQKKSDVTLAPKLTKELGRIDWSNDAQTIHNLVRGLLPWPSAHTVYKGKSLKILSTEFEPSKKSHPAGQVLAIEKRGFWVGTSSGELLVKEVHLESSKSMSATQFIAGHKLDIGFIFS